MKKQLYQAGRTLMLLCAVLASRSSIAQTGCIVSQDANATAQRPSANMAGCTNNSAAYLDYFRHKENFIPAFDIITIHGPEYTPETVIKKIKMRFVIHEPNASGPQINYRQADTPQLKKIIAEANNLLGYMPTSTIGVNAGCTNCYVQNARIKFELTEIEFINDPGNGYYVNNTFQPLGKYKDSILNVHFFRNDATKTLSQSSAWVAGVGSGYNGLYYVAFMNYYTTWSSPGFTAKTLIHEIGHIFGLPHLVEEYGPNSSDYLSDIFGSDAPSVYFANHPNDFDLSNNFLHGNTANYAQYSPMQLGRINRQMFLQDASKYCYPTEAPSIHPWLVSQDETWDFPIRMYQDIRVQPGVTLTIKCEVQMPPDSRIVVERGGKLVVDGGRITSYHNRSRWYGIELMGDELASALPANQGSVEIKNGAIISNARSAVNSFSGENGNHGGGIINATNSYFYNNGKCVALNGYGNYSYGSGACYFDNCEFTVDADGPFSDPPGDAYFTSYDTKGGVVIKGCKFRNEMSLGQRPQHQRNTAIYVLSTGIRITDCVFEDMTGGIYSAALAGDPGRNATIYDNKFNHITENIIVGATSYGDIRGNTINNMYPYTSGNTTKTGYGIYLDQTNGSYVGCDNHIDGTTDNPSFSNYATTGIIVNNSQSTGANVNRNDLTNLSTGISIQKNNPQLDVSCNRLKNNNLAWLVTNNSSSQAYLKNQGTGCGAGQTRAGNIFTSNVRDIASYLSNIWSYFAYTGGGNTDQFPFNTSGNISLTNCTGSNTSDPDSKCNIPWACLRVGVDPLVLKDNYDQLVSVNLRYSAEGRLLYGAIIRSYVEMDDASGLQTFLQAEDDDDSRRLLIPMYLNKADYTQMSATIGMLNLPVDEKRAYTRYYGTLAQLKQDKRSIDALTPSELTIIRGIAATDVEVSGFARALLEWSYGKYWDHAIDEEPNVALKSTPPQTGETPAYVTSKSRLNTATPNPANNHTLITIYITGEDMSSGASLILRALTGKEIASYKLKAGENRIEIDTRSWAPGLYFYSLMLNRHLCETKKLSVQH